MAPTQEVIGFHYICIHVTRHGKNGPFGMKWDFLVFIAYLTTI